MSHLDGQHGTGCFRQYLLLLRDDIDFMPVLREWKLEQERLRSKQSSIVPVKDQAAITWSVNIVAVTCAEVCGVAHSPSPVICIIVHIYIMVRSKNGELTPCRRLLIGTGQMSHR